MNSVRVPGPRDPSPRWMPHVLVVTRPDPEDPGLAEWEIEHHPDCPRSCHWYPGAAEFLRAEDERARAAGAPFGISPDDYDCYVAWEVANAGLDCLLDAEGRDWPTWSWSGKLGLDQTLPAGRYLIEGWYQSGEGRGEYGGMGDADGGLHLLGPAPEPVAA